MVSDAVSYLRSRPRVKSWEYGIAMYQDPVTCMFGYTHAFTEEKLGSVLIPFWGIPEGSIWVADLHNHPEYAYAALVFKPEGFSLSEVWRLSEFSPESDIPFSDAYGVRGYLLTGDGKYDVKVYDPPSRVSVQNCECLQ